MDWLNNISGVLQRYAGGAPDTNPESADRDFDEAAGIAPQESLMEGIADAFRSQQTPPFPSMLAQVFGNSGPAQRAGVLNSLITAAGPAVLGQILGRYGLGGGHQQITPEQAQNIPVEAVQEVAAEAERRDPSVIDRISGIYAQNPQLFKTLGATALTVVLANMARRQR